MSKGGTTGNGTRYCRTCGFADCPGKDTGDCPRWPAADEQAPVPGGPPMREGNNPRTGIAWNE